METSQRTGDAFDEKYLQYGRMLFRLSMVYLGNRADAEEAVQEAFLRLLYKSPDFSDGEQERRWLIRVAVNLCKDKLKSFWRRRVVSLEELEPYCASQEDLQLSHLLLKLPAGCRAAIHLYYYEDYTVSEIAKMLRISVSAVKMRLKRGREQLKLEMEEDTHES